MASVDMAPPCERCSKTMHRVVRHWPDTGHYSRLRRRLARLLRRI